MQIHFNVIPYLMWNYTSSGNALVPQDELLPQDEFMSYLQHKNVQGFHYVTLRKSGLSAEPA
jgi:hypothetical protein